MLNVQAVNQESAVGSSRIELYPILASPVFCRNAERNVRKMMVEWSRVEERGCARTEAVIVRGRERTSTKIKAARTSCESERRESSTTRKTPYTRVSKSRLLRRRRRTAGERCTISVEDKPQEATNQDGKAYSIRIPLPKKIPKWKTLSKSAGPKLFPASCNPSTYIVSMEELLQSAAEGNMEEVARSCTNLRHNLDFGSLVDGRTNFFHEFISVRWKGSEGSCIGCLKLLLNFDFRCGPSPKEDLQKTLDFVDEEGNTPLHIAARKKNLTAVRALLQLGAAPELFNKRNESPMLIAMRENERSIMKELYNHGANLPPLFRDKVFADKLASRFKKRFAEARNRLNSGVTELKPLEALFHMKGKAQHVLHIWNQQGALESLKGNGVFFVLYCCEVIVNIKNPSSFLFTCQDASPFSEIPFITTGHDDTQQHPLVAYRKNDKPELSMAYFIPTELMVRGAFKLNFRLCENEIRRHILAQIWLVKAKE